MFNEKDTTLTVSLDMVQPYDFALSLRAVRSFQPALPEHDKRLLLAARIHETPALIEVTQSAGPRSGLLAYSSPEVSESRIREIAEWVLFAELDLAPLYRMIAKDPRLASMVRELHGLKPMRPITLFEMAVIAITEQQLSLASAYHIRNRLIQRFGEPISNTWVFPEPAALANASPEELRSCGLSKQKTDYIQVLAGKIAKSNLDLEHLKRMGDNEARETIMGWKGFGPWSADYILVRGLARPDCVPVDDIGIRDVVGKYLGEGQRVSSLDVADKLEPFRPYRGLLAFYMLAAHRLKLTATR